MFWASIGLSGLSAIALAGSLTVLLGSQRPIVLRVVWVSASVLVASMAALILILLH